MDRAAKSASDGVLRTQSNLVRWSRRSACAVLFTAFATSPVYADIDGRAGATGAPPSRDCTRCHDPGAAVPTVALSGPTTVAPGSTTTYTVNISGGPARNASLGVAAVGGTLAVVDPGTKLLSNEIVHTGPRPMTAGAASFTFNFVAPATVGTATLYIAGVSDDGQQDTPGDGTRAIVQSITIANADTPPPPVNQAPTARITGPTTATAGTAAAFSGSGSTDPEGGVLTYQWTFGPTGTAPGASVSYTFLTAGTFPVTLTVTDDKGATATQTINVTVQNPGVALPPTANPGGPYTGTVGQPVQFDGKNSLDADGTIAAYNWIFGDGTTSTAMSPSKTYTTPGTYPVTLTVTDNTGMTDDETTTATIAPIAQANQPPVARIVAPNTANVQSLVHFGSTGSTDPDGEIVSYQWSFGDQVTAAGPDTVHIYTREGTFSVKLTVTDNLGAIGEATLNITVVGSAVPVAPTANPGGPYTGAVGQAISFSAAGSVDPDGNITSYRWDFGDGTTGTGVTPTKAYTAAGVYTVRLTVTDNAPTPATATATTTATIAAAPPAGANQPPVARITGPLAATVGVSVSFDGSTSVDPDGDALTYAWRFGDTGTGSGPTAAYTFLTAGTATVALTVTDSKGASDTDARNITLQAAGTAVAPTANPGGPYSGTVGVAIAFDGSRSVDADGIIGAYSWDFGDGTTSAADKPIKTYTTAGVYTVKLAVIDNTAIASEATTTATIAAVAGAGTVTESPTSPASTNVGGNSGEAGGGAFDSWAMLAWLLGLWTSGGRRLRARSRRV